MHSILFVSFLNSKRKRLPPLKNLDEPGNLNNYIELVLIPE